MSGTITHAEIFRPEIPSEPQTARVFFLPVFTQQRFHPSVSYLDRLSITKY